MHAKKAIMEGSGIKVISNLCFFIFISFFHYLGNEQSNNYPAINNSHLSFCLLQDSIDLDFTDMETSEANSNSKDSFADFCNGILALMEYAKKTLLKSLEKSRNSLK